jgi:hypothetical protein
VLADDAGQRLRVEEEHRTIMPVIRDRSGFRSEPCARVLSPGCFYNLPGQFERAVAAFEAAKKQPVREPRTATSSYRPLKQVTDADRTRLRSAYESGSSLTASARSIGIGHQRARKMLKSMGVDVPSPRSKLSDAEIAVVRQGLAEGLTPHALSRRTGIPGDRIRRWRQGQ